MPGLVRVARKYGAALALDDAHALGVLGPNGDGTAAHFGMIDEVDIIAGTFSKSLASIGGFVAASESVIHYLKHHSRPLIFTASLPPANTAGVLAALEVLQDEPERRDRLWANTRRLHEGFRQLGFDIGPTETPIVPVLIGPLEKTFLMWRRLFDAGVFTNPVAPPAVPAPRSAACGPASWRPTLSSRSTSLWSSSPASAGTWGSSEPSAPRPRGARPTGTSSASSICPTGSTRGTRSGSRRCVGTSRCSSPAGRIPSSSTPRPNTSSPSGTATVVGRIAAISNRLHNETHDDRVGFFGFFECIDDQAVADALFATAAEWCRRERGTTSCAGPASFSVNDECGLLVDGFEHAARRS